MLTHILGFPGVGKQRELKQALESFWDGNLSASALFETCAALKKRHWEIQRDAGLDYVATGDFSLYDRMLDLTLMLGAIPQRFAPCRGDSFPDLYFSLARGDVKRNTAALEMTKWFDTNYHYLVPEFHKNQYPDDFHLGDQYFLHHREKRIKTRGQVYSQRVWAGQTIDLTHVDISLAL